METKSQTGSNPGSESATIDIKSTYANQRVLLTGATGFLGGVVLEKLLWEIGEHVEAIFCLISPSGARRGADRLWKDVLSAPSFGRLRERHGTEWVAWVGSRVHAVDGDLGEENLALDSGGFEAVSSCDVVLHCAAARQGALSEAFAANTMGTLILLDIVETASQRPDHTEKRPVAFVHVSTADVAAAQEHPSCVRPLAPSDLPPCLPLPPHRALCHGKGSASARECWAGSRGGSGGGRYYAAF